MSRVRTGCLIVLAALLPLLAPALVPTSTGGPSGLPAAAAATPNPYRVPGSWRMIFWDGFSGTRLKTGNWRPNWLGSSDRSVTKPVNTEERSCYDPRNVSVRGGTLRLTAQKRRCRATNGHTYAYASGLVESRHDFRFSYGYAEARMYLPPSNGSRAPRGSCGPNWPAFWLNGDRWPQDGEIDVMECLSGDDTAWHYHWGSGSGREAGAYPSGWRNDMPGSSGWHVFGVDWAPGRATFYYDGKRVGSHRVGITGTPHYLILNLGVSGSRIATPQTVQVDYVRVWKRR
jgi:beta-glucanase (GH16 family)